MFIPTKKHDSAPKKTTQIQPFIACHPKEFLAHILQYNVFDVFKIILHRKGKHTIEPCVDCGVTSMAVNLVEKLFGTGKIEESGSLSFICCGESRAEVQGKRLFLMETSYSEAGMTKEKLVDRIKVLLKIDADLSSLLFLRRRDLERLIIWIGDKKE